MEFGGHMSSAGGIYTAIDRIEAIGGDCVQCSRRPGWRPIGHKPEAVERFRERRAEAGIGGVVCHALYLINLASDEFRGKSVAALRATLEVAGEIEAGAVIFHVGSHLGAGFEGSVDGVVSGLQAVLDGYDGEPWLAMENSAGPGGTIGRSIGELATLVDALDRHPRLGICLDSCHLYASGYDVATPRGDISSRRWTRRSASRRLTALHVNDSATPPGRTVTPRTSSGRIGEGCPSPTPPSRARRLHGGPGAGDGPDRNQLKKLRELHTRWTV
jgi:deoxyribonuclease-4